MKLTAAIFVTYISLLSVLPGLCELFTVVKKVELCCSTTSDDCSTPQTTNQQKSNTADTDAPSTPCCSLQNCQCYFLGVVQFDFIAPITITIKKLFLENDIVSSTYLSDCWHPPKVV